MKYVQRVRTYQKKYACCKTYEGESERLSGSVAVGYFLRNEREQANHAGYIDGRAGLTNSVAGWWCA